MGLWEAPKVTNDTDIKGLKNLVQMLINELDFVINGNLSSGNVREIGGYQVGSDYLRSKNGLVGLSSAKLGGSLDDVRIWAGSADMANAPFRVYNSGKAVLSNIEITGGTISWGAVNAPTASDTGAATLNDPRFSQLAATGAYLGALAQGQVSGLPDRLVNLSSIGDYIGALSQGQVTGLSTRLTKITSTGVYTGTVGTDQLIAGSALIGAALIEQLVVGSNVLMGSAASISWGQVTSKPDYDTPIATAQSTANGALTTAAAIANGTYSGGTFIDSKNVASPNITGGTITGALFRTAVSGYRMEMSSSGLRSFNSLGQLEGVVLDSSNFSYQNFYYQDQNRGGLSQVAGILSLYALNNADISINQFSNPNGHITIQAGSNGRTYAKGTWDFSTITTVGLTPDKVTGLETRLKYLEDRAFILAYVVGGSTLTFNSKNTPGVDSVTI